MSKHTPGPWVAKKIQSGGLSYWQISERQYNGFEICSTANAEVAPDEANARLIAAAPELLKGLKDVFVLLDSGYLVRNIERDAESGWALRQLGPITSLQNALAAIEKAEGKKND